MRSLDDVPQNPTVRVLRRCNPRKYLREILFSLFYRHMYKLYRLGLYRVDYYKKYYEVKEGEVVVDAGAHLGLTAVELSKAVGSKGLVIAIEPEPRNLEGLRRAIAELDNIKVVSKGLWSSKGLMKLHLHRHHDAHSLLKELVRSGDFRRSIVIEVDTLDNILAELGVHNVNFIKMNIEGAEVEALRGAEQVLKNNNVKLAIEAHHEVNGEPAYKLIIPWFARAGFVAFLGPKGVVYASRSESVGEQVQ